MLLMKRISLILGLCAFLFPVRLAAQNPGCPGGGTHCTILTWTASPTFGVVGYNIYRSQLSGKETAPPLNGITPISALAFEDDTVSAGTFYYVVTAIASDGVTESSPSNEASDTIPGIAPSGTFFSWVNCYLNIMRGAPDGTGNFLSFNAASCYSAVPVALGALFASNSGGHMGSK